MNDFLKNLLKKSNNPHYIFGGIIGVLSIVLIFLIFVQLVLSRDIAQQTPLPDPLLSITFSDYPTISKQIPFTITGEAAIVMDDDSKTILYQKNAYLQFSPASTTKIMTALVGLEHFKLDDVMTIQTPLTQPVIMGFYKGEKVTFGNLLYAMLLPSANDAALAIADNYPGGQAAFIAEMNQKAKELHLYHTHFADPIGLEDDGDYTTVVDLAHLASVAMQNQIFAQIVDTQYYTVHTVDGGAIPVKNINELLGLYGVDGIKTGFTGEARQVLVTSVMRNNHRLIIVVMRSDDRFADTKVLINAIADNITYLPMHP